jgi:hypothetical protein
MTGRKPRTLSYVAGISSIFKIGNGGSRNS